MFTVSSPSLPTAIEDQQYPGGLLTAIAPPTYPGGLLTVVDYGAADPPTATTGRSRAVEQNTGAIASETYTISTTLITIYRAVSAGGVIWMPAADITNPQPGEFVLSGGNAVLVTGESYAIAEGESVQLIGANQDEVVSTAIARIPQFLTQIPVKAIDWGCSLESHPSGSITLSVNGLTQKQAVLSALAHGTEIEIDGIGFRTGQASVEQSAIASFPYGKFTVSIPLEGKWQNYVDEPFTLRSLGVDSDTLSANPSDECTNADSTIIDEVAQSNYTLTEIAAAVGATYQGPEVRVPVPRDAQAGEFTTFDVEFQDRLRINGAIADYNQSQAICMKPIDSGRVWDYRGAIILNSKITQQINRVDLPQAFTPSSALLPPKFTQVVTGAIAPSPTFPATEESGALAIEWNNYQLTGQFSSQLETDDTEETLGQASGRDRWTRRQRETETFEEGDPSPTQPPDGAQAIRSVSLNHDVSGPTKVLSRTRKLDGVTELVEQWRYGYAFIANAIAVDGELQGAPSAHWMIVEYTRTEYLFDSETGYALGYDRTGWRRSRFRTETEDAPETLTLDPSDPEYSLYQFEIIPILERERYLLKQHRDTYQDDGSSSEPRGQLERVCLPDGTFSYRYRRNPNYSEPFYKSATSREHVSFSWRDNPESTDEEPRPPLITGKEESTRSTLDIQPGKLQKRRFGANSGEQPSDRMPDRYSEYQSLFTAQDPGFSNSLELSSFRDYEGRPGVADKLPPLFAQETEPPEGDNGNGDEDQQGDRMYLLNTSTTPPDYLGQTKNYQWASTLDQAVLAAETDAYLEQLQGGDRESIAIPWNPEIRPGDKFIYELMGEIRRRFVLNVSWKPKLSDGKATGYTELELARDLKPTIYRTEIDLPKVDEVTGDGNGLGIGIRQRKGFTLGEILPAAIISRGKGNYGN